MYKLKPFAIHVLIAMFIAVLAMPSLAQAAANRYRVNGRLFGSSTLKGNARYEERPKNGSLMRRFKVEVQHGTPGQTFTVSVNGSDVGTIVVGPIGRGKFELRTPQHIDSPGDGQPMPWDFPMLTIGNVVQVGHAYITLAECNHGGGWNGGDDDDSSDDDSSDDDDSGSDDDDSSDD